MQLSVIFVLIFLCSYWIVSWHLLRGEIKQKKIVGLRARFSPPHSSLPVSASGSTDRQNNPKLWQVNLLAEYITIIHLSVGG